jgi:hypothetical protein
MHRFGSISPNLTNLQTWVIQLFINLYGLGLFMVPSLTTGWQSKGTRGMVAASARSVTWGPLLEIPTRMCFDTAHTEHSVH